MDGKLARRIAPAKRIERGLFRDESAKSEGGYMKVFLDTAS
jgi:hypothetical protein